MGCREAHVKKGAENRSADYYQSKEGRVKKKALNAKRKKPDSNPQSTAPVKPSDMHDEALAEYLQSTLSMIEGRRISQDEIREHIARWNERLRQQGLEDGKKNRILRDD